MSMLWLRDVGNSLISFFMVAAVCRDIPCFSPIYMFMILDSVSFYYKFFFECWSLFLLPTVLVLDCFLSLLNKRSDALLFGLMILFLQYVIKQSPGYTISWSFISRSSSTKALFFFCWIYGYLLGLGCMRTKYGVVAELVGLE